MRFFAFANSADSSVVSPGRSPYLDLVLANPVVQRTGAEPELGGGGSDGLAGPHESDSTETELGREGSWHGRSLSMSCTDLHTYKGKHAMGQVKESSKPGTVPLHRLPGNGCPKQHELPRQEM